MPNLTPFKMIRSQLLAALFDAGAVFGITLVVYGAVVWLFRESWPILDSIIKWVSPAATVLGVAAVVVSIYFPQNPTPPKKLSRWLTAPAVLLMMTSAIITMIVKKEPIPDRSEERRV